MATRGSVSSMAWSRPHHHRGHAAFGCPATVGACRPGPTRAGGVRAAARRRRAAYCCAVPRRESRGQHTRAALRQPPTISRSLYSLGRRPRRHATDVDAGAEVRPAPRHPIGPRAHVVPRMQEPPAGDQLSSKRHRPTSRRRRNQRRAASTAGRRTSGPCPTAHPCLLPRRCGCRGRSRTRAG